MGTKYERTWERGGGQCECSNSRATHAQPMLYAITSPDAWVQLASVNIVCNRQGGKGS